MSSGKLFQTAGAACEKARPAKARLVRSSCSRFLPQDRSWREGARNMMISGFVPYISSSPGFVACKSLFALRSVMFSE